MAGIIGVLQLVALLLLSLSFTSLLEWKHYHPMALLAAYGGLFGLPTLWLPSNTERRPDPSDLFPRKQPLSKELKEAYEKAFFMGAGAVLVVGIVHLIAWFSGSDRSAVGVFFSVAAFAEVLGSGTLSSHVVRNEDEKLRRIYALLFKACELLKVDDLYRPEQATRAAEADPPKRPSRKGRVVVSCCLLRFDEFFGDRITDFFGKNVALDTKDDELIDGAMKAARRTVQ